MARYIDADALKTDILKKYRGNWEIPCSSEDGLIQRVVTDLRVLIEQSITADVAPKSEIEKLVQDVTRLVQENETLKDNNEHLAVMLTETKTEVARDIFEAVLDVYKNTCDADFEEELAELKKKYTEE